MAKTLIYVAAFGLGSLFLSALLSWLGASMAEGMLPGGATATDKDAPSSGAAPSAGAFAPIRGGGARQGTAERQSPKPGSKAERPRANEAAPRSN